MTKLALLGGMTPQQFLRDYWHKKPLLIRQAIPGFQALLKREALFEMASRDDVESRLISHFDNHWEMQKGPLSALPSVAKEQWTLLVQGVNLHDDAADQLMQQFRFLPDARLDDLMISYATDGGGVGPHFDSYDVFLLQAHGKRRWRIGAQKDLSLVEGMPLKILKNFRPQEEYVLEPGDMLYLPPHYAHDGIAEGECMTYSIGFRTPHYQELAEAFLQFMADTIEIEGRYADPDLAPVRHPAEISTAMVGKVSEEIAKIRFSEDDITVFLGEYLSEPKSTVFFDSPDKPLSPARFRSAALKRGVALSRKTRMLYRGGHVFINGESFRAGRADKPSLVRLADARRLAPEEVGAVSEDVFEALLAWYEDGWLELG
ncbi:ribosomal protein uL16 3-hydroxylase [Noviherbaspirillum galbum]|uniref:Cupin domain-containing protein n=1 Tax=Noviherbaspirillum galbum TaxID=2709383 RepID=A0A6B3SQB9_9BURK|nr:cupin domain-containing protein [Noviherbaspirillum galbum]NEX59909.1 cupin domain-containing protein [Noviherbaspirillum galbum]